MSYDDYDLTGGARQLSQWNIYVKENAHRFKGDKTLKKGDMLRILAKEARAKGIVGNAKPVQKSACAQPPYNAGRQECNTKPECAWREQGLTKKGTIRKGFCTKGQRPLVPRYNFE